MTPEEKAATYPKGEPVKGLKPKAAAKKSAKKK
jgi:hypothetical protein